MKRLLLCLLLVACEKPAIETRDTDNKKMSVDLLFTNDGCKIYRFTDDGRLHYYADCGGTMSTRNEVHTTYNGKTSTTYTIPVVEDVPNYRTRR